MRSQLRSALLPIALAFGLSHTTLTAQPAYMVADLGETTPYGYSLWFGPLSEHLSVGGKFYFFEDDGIHGRELWRSDGTALGTYLIRDLCPGSCGTRFPFWSSMAALGDDLLFAADDGVHGVELWITDGTALGTRMVLDLQPGYGSSAIQNLTTAGDQAFFVAQSDGQHSALWRTDGTAKGTYALTPPGPTESFAPSSIHPGPGFLYLCNADWGGQAGLWRSDGTSSGTTFVAPVGCWQNSIGKRATMIVSPDGVLYFQGQAGTPGPVDPELWRSDGTPTGTWRVKDVSPGDNGSWPSGLVFLGSELLFTADGGLWRTDGTEAGTVPVPLADDAQPLSDWGEWTVAGNSYYFAATDPDHGTEPWVYDGATASRIVDLVPGAGSSIVSDFPYSARAVFESFGAEAIFTAAGDAFGLEVWRTDGSAAGTVRISDIAPGAEGLRLPVYWPLQEASLGGRPVLFESQPATGERLWRLDPSGSAMQLVDVLNSQTPLFEPRGTDRLSLFEPERGSDCFVGAGAHLFFEDRLSEPPVIDLFRTDGALSGPEPIFAALPPRDGACGHQSERLLYVRVTDPPNADAELLAIDAASGLSETLLASGVELRSQPPFLDLGDHQVFGLEGELFRTDGTPAGTTLVASELVGYGSRIDRFLDEIVIADSALSITDAQEPTGARLLLAGDNVSLSVAPELAPLGPTLVFLVWDEAHGGELWTSDGTAEGTALLIDAVPGPGSLFRGVSIDRYTEYNDAELVGADTFAVLAGATPAAGEELWVTDGTALGTGLLRDIYSGDYPSTPRQFTRLGNRIVFSAEDEAHGLELWVTDGTYPGTTLLKDVAPGLASSVPDDLIVRDGALYFSAWSPSYGREAWKSDGTSAGTVRISDVAPGPLSSSPQRFARAGNRLYFSATDQVHGYELWAISDDGSLPLFLDGFGNETTDRWSEVMP
jgi:ELWxxDGT repeat protein